MAQKITVVLEDDLDGGPADQTVRFGLDGAEYEIDLSISNATAFVRSWPLTPHAPARPFGAAQRAVSSRFARCLCRWPTGVGVPRRAVAGGSC
jgi:hypothetical protein